MTEGLNEKNREKNNKLTIRKGAMRNEQHPTIRNALQGKGNFPIRVILIKEMSRTQKETEQAEKDKAEK